MEEKKRDMNEILEDLREILFGEVRVDHEWYLENLDKLKDIVDKSPRKFLDQHLENALKDEHYELAEHIKRRIELLDGHSMGGGVRDDENGS